MMDYRLLFDALEKAGGGEWVERLPGQLAKAFAEQGHGDLLRWAQAVEELPNIVALSRELVDEVRVGVEADLSESERLRIRDGLMKLHPWRKGPYQLYGIHVDTEWRSDWKWNRLKDRIAPLDNRLVLDVGCGNGYHGWRMLGAGARVVVGVDPTLLSVMQFQAVRKLYGDAAIFVLPLGIEDVPGNMRIFDTVFSMGVFYHRRSPIDHLMELKGCLRPGGELVLETLIIAGDETSVLVPGGRYAQMRNVWFLPSCEALKTWMCRCGFKNVRLVDVSKTTHEEQRTTDWMRFNSLKDFLDPNNDELTCEGFPAPVRAIFLANVE